MRALYLSALKFAKMTWMTVDEIKQKDTKGEIHHLEDVSKTFKDVNGVTCNSLAEVEWVRSKLRDECNRWSFEGMSTPCQEKKKYEEFAIDEKCQPSKLSLPKVGIEAGTNPVPRLRFEESILPNKFEQTTGRYYELQIMDGKVKMTPAEGAHKH